MYLYKPYTPPTPQDTCSSPTEAYAEAQKALFMFSSALNKGVQQMETVHETTEKVQKNVNQQLKRFKNLRQWNVHILLPCYCPFAHYSLMRKSLFWQVCRHGRRYVRIYIQGDAQPDARYENRGNLYRRAGKQVGQYSDSELRKASVTAQIKKDISYISPKNGYQELIRINDEGEKLRFSRNRMRESKRIRIAVRGTEWAYHHHHHRKLNIARNSKHR